MLNADRHLNSFLGASDTDANNLVVRPAVFSVLRIGNVYLGDAPLPADVAPVVIRVFRY